MSRQGMSERQYSRHSGLSRGGVRHARDAGRLVCFADGSIDPVASDRRYQAMTDPAMRRKARNPKPPLPVELAGDDLDPFHVGILTGALHLLHQLRALTAAMTVESGAPLRVAHRVAESMALAGAAELIDYFTRNKIGRFATEDGFDLGIFEPDAEAEPDWAALAMQAGERVDRRAWKEFDAERNALAEAG